MLSESDTYLKDWIFRPVVERVKDRRDSLLNIARFPRVGIEGWLKVEATRALLGHIKKILNEGPDLQISDDLFVELKGATDCNPSWIIQGLKYDEQDRCKQIACLFLGSGANISACLEQLKQKSKIVAYECFVVGRDEWVVGLIVPTPRRPEDDALR